MMVSLANNYGNSLSYVTIISIFTQIKMRKPFLLEMSHLVYVAPGLLVNSSKINVFWLRKIGITSGDENVVIATTH